MVMFMKNAQCPSTMTTNLTLCDHIYHIWEKGLVMQFALISMGYLIDGDDSVMHEGMVWRTPLTWVLAQTLWKDKEEDRRFNRPPGKTYESSHLGVADGDRTECRWELSYGQDPILA